jgi:anti-sigma factor RsiW
MVMMSRRKRERPGHELTQLAALADGSLAPERRAALEARVAASPELSEQLDEQLRAVELMRSAATEIEAPAALRARIETQRSVRRGQPRRVVLGVVAAATALAVAAGLVLFGTGTTGERLHADLAATGLARGASGTATLTQTASGWRVRLDARGLSRLAGGRFYEAWLRDRNGVLVPVGTFNEGRNVTLWAGVSPKEFTTLTVTRETSDGDQASTGEKVLVGQIETRG